MHHNTTDNYTSRPWVMPAGYPAAYHLSNAGGFDLTFSLRRVAYSPAKQSSRKE